MTTEKTPPLKPGAWRAYFDSGEREGIILDEQNEVVAVVRGADFQEVYPRSLFLASAPELKDAVIAAFMAFGAQARAGTDLTARGAAKKMLSMMIPILAGAGVAVRKPAESQEPNAVGILDRSLAAVATTTVNSAGYGLA